MVLRAWRKWRRTEEIGGLMRTLYLALTAVMLLPATAEAKKKPHVVIQKPLPPAPSQPVAITPLVAIPVIGVFYDLNRRISCLDPPDPLGAGGPGFDGKPTPPTNVMI